MSGPLLPRPRPLPLALPLPLGCLPLATGRPLTVHIPRPVLLGHNNRPQSQLGSLLGHSYNAKN